MTGIIVFILRILLAISLYAFLVWALYTLWNELRTSQHLLNSKKVPILSVQVLEIEPENVHQYNSTQLLIGRDPTCDVCLPNELVSAQHARLSFHHNQWWVEDLQSTNGTFLNDERVYTPTVLISGDELRCGKINMRIGFGDHLDRK
jgi:hypothetical protein